MVLYSHELIHYAMIELKSADPGQRRRWAAYGSHVMFSPNPKEFVVGELMAMPVLGLVEQHIPKIGETVVPNTRKGRGMHTIQMLCRSPCFPYHSLMVRALAHGLGGHYESVQPVATPGCWTGEDSDEESSIVYHMYNQTHFSNSCYLG